jgi:hypothetical protein
MPGDASAAGETCLIRQATMTQAQRRTSNRGVVTMRSITKFLLAGLPAALLCGCASNSSKLSLNLAASPLDSSYDYITINCKSSGSSTIRSATSLPCNDFEKAQFLVSDSQKKCGTFVTHLQELTAAVNTQLDVASAALSAAASVVTPLKTTQSLTAGAGFLTATKLSISNEYLSSLTISHVIQAIQQTYGNDMSAYLTDLDNPAKVDQDKVIFLAELPRIQAIHNECSLASAEGTIGSSLQSAPATAATSPNAATASVLDFTAPTTTTTAPSNRTPPPSPGHPVATPTK